MSNFYDTIRNSKYFGSDVVCKDMAMLEPGTRAAVLALVADAKAGGIDLRVLETYRSQTRQSALFMKHATQLRTVGCHGYGVACDFGVFTNGKYEEGNKPYVFLRDLARKHGLISGQDWGHAKEGSFVDSGHVQRCPVWRQGALFGGSWYPPAVYDPYADSEANHHADVVLNLGAAPKAFPAKPAPTAPGPHPTAYAAGSVEWVQEKLNEWAPSFKLQIDGVPGLHTTYAIKRFQQEHKLVVSGVVDVQTAKALAAT